MRQRDCSCWLCEDTPQRHCIPQAKCCLCQVLSWLYGRKTKGNYWGVQSCHSSCFCGLSCWQSHKKAVLGELCSQLLSQQCQAPREECGHAKEPQKPSQPQLEGRSGTPWAQQSHQTTSSSHPNTASANGCSWRVIPAHP